jgi:hypothetical protein
MMVDTKEYQQVLLSPIPLSELKEVLTTIVREEVRAKVQEDLESRFLSPKETCALFCPKISLVTLNSWANKGLLTKYTISGRTYFKASEVTAALTTLKKYKQN